MVTVSLKLLEVWTKREALALPGVTDFAARQ